MLDKTLSMKSVNSNRTSNKDALFIFFIHPFAAFLYAIKDLKGKYSFQVLLLFFILFGYTFIAQNEAADSFRYIENFNYYKSVTSVKYLSDINDYFTLDSNIKDIYHITSYFLVSRITKSYHVLMALWAFVFSFFFLKAFRFLIDRQEWNKSWTVIIITFLFFFSNPITNINGVRFWTAAWIGVYSAFKIVLNKNFKYLTLALITPLIHISFTSYLAVLLIYMFSFKYDKVWVIIFVISFFVGNIAIELSQYYRNILPVAFQNMVWSYTESDFAMERMVGLTTPFYVKVLNSAPLFFINALIFIFIAKSRIIKQNTDAYSGYLFILVWMSFVNFALPIPSFGGRFFVLVVPFVMYLCLILYKKIPLLKRLLLFSPLIYSYVIFQWLRFINSIIDYDLIYSVFPHLLIKNLY